MITAIVDQPRSMGHCCSASCRRGVLPVGRCGAVAVLFMWLLTAAPGAAQTAGSNETATATTVDPTSTMLATTTTTSNIASSTTAAVTLTTTGMTSGSGSSTPLTMTTSSGVAPATTDPSGASVPTDTTELSTSLMTTLVSTVWSTVVTTLAPTTTTTTLAPASSSMDRHQPNAVDEKQTVELLADLAQSPPDCPCGIPAYDCFTLELMKCITYWDVLLPTSVVQVWNAGPATPSPPPPPLTLSGTTTTITVATTSTSAAPTSTSTTSAVLSTTVTTPVSSLTASTSTGASTGTTTMTAAPTSTAVSNSGGHHRFVQQQKQQELQRETDDRTAGEERRRFVPQATASSGADVPILSDPRQINVIQFTASTNGSSTCSIGVSPPIKMFTSNITFALNRMLLQQQGQQVGQQGGGISFPNSGALTQAFLAALTASKGSTATMTTAAGVSAAGGEKCEAFGIQSIRVSNTYLSSPYVNHTTNDVMSAVVLALCLLLMVLFIGRILYWRYRLLRVRGSGLEAVAASERIRKGSARGSATVKAKSGGGDGASKFDNKSSRSGNLFGFAPLSAEEKHRLLGFNEGEEGEGDDGGDAEEEQLVGAPEERGPQRVVSGKRRRGGGLEDTDEDNDDGNHGRASGVATGRHRTAGDHDHDDVEMTPVPLLGKAATTRSTNPLLSPSRPPPPRTETVSARGDVGGVESEAAALKFQRAEIRRLQDFLRMNQIAQGRAQRDLQREREEEEEDLSAGERRERYLDGLRQEIEGNSKPAEDALAADPSAPEPLMFVPLQPLPLASPLASTRQTEPAGDGEHHDDDDSDLDLLSGGAAEEEVRPASSGAGGGDSVDHRNAVAAAAAVVEAPLHPPAVSPPYRGEDDTTGSQGSSEDVSCVPTPSVAPAAAAATAPDVPQRLHPMDPHIDAPVVQTTLLPIVPTVPVAVGPSVDHEDFGDFLLSGDFTGISPGGAAAEEEEDPFGSVGSSDSDPLGVEAGPPAAATAVSLPPIPQPPALEDPLL